MKPKIGIRATIDGRRGGVRESLEEQTAHMAMSAKKLIEENVFYADGTPVQCVLGSMTIGGSAEAAQVAGEFSAAGVTATLTVTPCWCYGSETIDVQPGTAKAVWGFNGTERPGAVYLAAAMAAHAQYGLPAFSIYGHDVQDKDDTSIPSDVSEKILRFARAALAAGQMKNKSYVGIGGVSMGIAGSTCNPDFLAKYLGVRAEWVDMVEILRRMDLKIYDEDEYEIALGWTKKNCKEGIDLNANKFTAEQKADQWEFAVKMTLICRDILLGNKKLANKGFIEESLGRNAILGGFQGQRMWSDYKPNGDFTEAILNTSFDWTGKRAPLVFATENDGLNGIAMLFLNLLTGRSPVFADVRTYWSPDAVKRVTGAALSGKASNGFMHLINSGAAALDGCGESRQNGEPVIKKWWDMDEKDIDACLKATSWCPANNLYFRGGGFSSKFETAAEFPVTLARINIIGGLGPVLQIAEGYTLKLPENINRTLLDRTDPTWPSTWFVPNLTGSGAFTDVYSVMANWGANHGAFTYGHIGDDLITLASILRIPVSMHNVSDERIFRPHCFSAFGTESRESADYRACAAYGPLYG